MIFSKEARRNVLLTLGASAFALITAEIVVRIVDPVRPADRVEFEVDERTYWRLRPNQSDNRPPATNVNSSGFRGTREAGQKERGRLRVFVIGDSYTWGQGVADDQTYSAQLEALAGGKLEVINGGTPGWGIFQFQAQLERWIKPLSPDVVVVLVNTADILRQPYPSAEEEQAFLRQSALRNRIREFSRLVTASYRLIERYKLQAQNRVVANAYGMDRYGGVPEGTFARLLAADTHRLREMNALAKEHNARLVLVVWPQQVPMTPAFLSSMESFAVAQDVGYVDLSMALGRYDASQYSLPNDHHPSVLGHRIIAAELWSVISGSLTPAQ